ncbi:hypothetical protein Tco_0849153 [Tanacetum coccineum]
MCKRNLIFSAGKGAGINRKGIANGHLVLSNVAYMTRVALDTLLLVTLVVFQRWGAVSVGYSRVREVRYLGSAGDCDKRSNWGQRKCEYPRKDDFKWLRVNFDRSLLEELEMTKAVVGEVVVVDMATSLDC